MHPHHATRRAPEVLQDPLWVAVARDLDAVELWSGSETVVKAARRRGLSAEPYDKERDEDTEDITSAPA